MQTVAVLMTAYQGMLYIEEQIRTVLAQKNAKVHVFLSVDQSSDATYSYCETLAASHAQVTLLPYGETFGGAAKNFFRLIQDVDFSGFDYVALADQDDIWLENKLDRAMTCLKAQNVDAYSSNVIAFWEDGRKKLIKKACPQTQFDFHFESAGPGCTFVLKQQGLQTFKVFMQTHQHEVEHVALHDWLIYAFYRTHGLTWFIDDEAYMLYRQHDVNQVGSNAGFKAFLKRVKMVKSHWYRQEVTKIHHLFGDLSGLKSLHSLYLLRHFYVLRRRFRDKLVLACFLVVGLF